MKLRLSLLIAFTVALALLTLLNLATPAQATRPAIAPPVFPDDPPTPGDLIPLVEYLVGLTLPDLAKLTIPADLSPAEATGYAHHLTQQQAQSLRMELEQWQAAGRIASYRVWPERHALVVQLPADSTILSALARLPGVLYVAPLAESTAACSAGAAAALAQQIEIASQWRSGSASGRAAPQPTPTKAITLAPRPGPTPASSTTPSTR